jgi:hypothetical protein
MIRPSTIVYWFRFALGVLAAVLLVTLELKGTTGIILMVVLYVISYLVVRHGLRYGESELKGKQKAVTLGVGTYIFTWAAVWILLYTLYPY